MNEKTFEDDLIKLAIPSWDRAFEEIRSGKSKEAIDLLQYIRKESEKNNDILVAWIDTALTYIAGFGEENVFKISKQYFYPSAEAFVSKMYGVKETLQKCTESQKRHHANFTISEEPDRYVVRYDPCGTGGRLRRTRDVGLTKKAYPWSWGMAGVPYYCCHCCLHWEIIPAELCGYPIKITLVGSRPEDPCIHLFYKKPELIPQEYLTRIGMEKKM